MDTPPFATTLPFEMKPIVAVIASVNYKGGVGKTTSARVLAQGIASDPDINKGKPVLIIDLDPQCNTTERWELTTINLDDGSLMPIPHPELEKEQAENPDAFTGYTFSSICDLWMDLLQSGAQAVAPLPYSTKNPLIHVVPAHENFLAAASRLPDEQVSVLAARFVEWLRDPALAEQYCCVVIDTQPTKSILIDAALAASTHAYIPLIPEPQPVRGAMSMIAYVARRRTERLDEVPLRFLGLLLSMYDKRLAQHNEIVRDIERHPNLGPILMPVQIRRRTNYSVTDDHRNQPQQVTDMKDPAIRTEAIRFTKYVWGEVQKDAEHLKIRVRPQQ